MGPKVSLILLDYLIISFLFILWIPFIISTTSEVGMYLHIVFYNKYFVIIQFSVKYF
jgi:hypothetical protein